MDVKTALHKLIASLNYKLSSGISRGVFGLKIEQISYNKKKLFRKSNKDILVSVYYDHPNLKRPYIVWKAKANVTNKNEDNFFMHVIEKFYEYSVFCKKVSICSQDGYPALIIPIKEFFENEEGIVEEINNLNESNYE